MAALLIGFFLLRSGDGRANEAPAPDLEAAGAPVRVISPGTMTLPQRISYSGSIESWEQAYITAPAGARIERIHVREGDRVRRGQVLVNMESANLRQAEVQRQQAQNDLERLERLVEIGSVARQQAEQARVQYETASAQVELLGRNTVLRSPIDGVVTARHFTEGEMFMAGAGTPSVVTIMQTNPVRVIVNVSERYYPHIRQGMTATVRLDTYGDRAFLGTVEQMVPVVSADSRTFRIELRVDNSDGSLSPGMFARVEIDLGEITGTFLPVTALVQPPGNEDPYVYVLEGDVVRRQDVRVGDRVEEYQQVIDGLSETDVVVLEGQSRLMDGARVRIVE